MAKKQPEGPGRPPGETVANVRTVVGSGEKVESVDIGVMLLFDGGAGEDCEIVPTIDLPREAIQNKGLRELWKPHQKVGDPHRRSRFLTSGCQR